MSPQPLIPKILILADIFLAVVTTAIPIGNLRPNAAQPEVVNRIQEVLFFGLNTTMYDDLGAADGALPSPVHPDSADAFVRDYASQQIQSPPLYDHPCSAVSKIFTSGTFYYAPAPVWDISSRLSQRIRKSAEIGDPLASFDERFVWNEYIVKSLLEFRERLDILEKEELDACQFIVIASIILLFFLLNCTSRF